MQRRWFQIAVAALWLAPVVILAQHWLVWDQLPPYMATHFRADGQPNGWMTRERAAIVPAAILLPVLVIATVFLVRVRKPETAVWAVVALFYLIAGAMVAISQQIINFNLHRAPMRVGPVVAAVMIGVLVCVVTAITAGRGRTLSEGPVLAEERHNSPLWAFVFLFPLAVMIWILFHIPDGGVRLAVGAVSGIFILVAGMTVSGFQYKFTQSGIEVRTLGFRLRSIPKEEIRSYEKSKWSALGGYGIRGIGPCRAYVWGRSGVRITTSGGIVFLGHEEPERLIRNLDVLTHTV